MLRKLNVFPKGMSFAEGRKRWDPASFDMSKRLSAGDKRLVVYAPVKALQDALGGGQRIATQAATGMGMAKDFREIGRAHV